MKKIVMFLLMFVVLSMSTLAVGDIWKIHFSDGMTTINGTDVCLNDGTCLSNSSGGSSYVDDWINTTIDTKDVIANNSMKAYVDSIVGGEPLWTANQSLYLLSTDYVTNITAVNASMKAYVDSIVGGEPLWTANQSLYLLSTDYVINITAVNASMKAYVDAQVGGEPLWTANQSLYLSVADYTINITAVNASMKDYIDSTKLNLTGGRMEGNINVSDYNLSNVNTLTFNFSPVNHKIYDNSTCVIITGDTSRFNIC